MEIFFGNMRLSNSIYVKPSSFQVIWLSIFWSSSKVVHNMKHHQILLKFQKEWVETPTNKAIEAILVLEIRFLQFYFPCGILCFIIPFF